jgi:hypothetical protein
MDWRIPTCGGFEKGDTDDMRALFWLWIGFLLVCIVTDSVAFWVVRSVLGESLGLALDAALVGGIAEEDLIWGRQSSRKEKAEEWAREILRRNLSASLTDKLTFSFELIRENDRLWAEGQVKTEILYLLGSLTGKGGREIVINRKLAYQGLYK